MSFSGEKADALRLLEGIEQGKLGVTELYELIKKIDPLLFYFVIRYLREALSKNQQVHEAIAVRLTKLFSEYPDLPKLIRAGERDVMREWFDDTYNIRDFAYKAPEFVELVYDKLES